MRVCRKKVASSKRHRGFVRKLQDKQTELEGQNIYLLGQSGLGPLQGEKTETILYKYVHVKMHIQNAKLRK